MISFLFILLSQPYSILPGVGLPGGDSAQLLLLIEQSQKQVEALQKILQNSELTSEQMKHALELTAHLNEGIDSKLNPLKDTKEYHAALIAIQNREDFAATHSLTDQSRVHPELLGPDELKKNNQSYLDFKNFQSGLVRANEADIQNFQILEKQIAESPPGALSRLHAEAASKNWETNLRLSMQLTELLDQMRSVREEMVQQRVHTRENSTDEEVTMKNTLDKIFSLEKSK
ncbi:MAG: hypothetical protein JWQ35_2122 [Bacteriovoracaceae bacterium]|nr:hypothetical protein [Bacteriovoracaceae bacterium]